MPSKIRIRDDDPLSLAIAPPLNETPAERDMRIRAEMEAKRVSDAIDDEINKERMAAKKIPPPVKILLLGESQPHVVIYRNAYPRRPLA
jgi:guanine nucleotide-binding protein alpha-1 subunit